ncbi:Uncharacterised protein [Mycobacteroides abscessus subsp. abscessus]|nr:Uncharacterised protein [Mycobacteroides abscessus subsp. abscessus]
MRLSGALRNSGSKNGNVMLYPVAKMMTSTSVDVPSSKCTVWPSKRLMSGLGTISPDPRRKGSSTDWVKCASPNLWFGIGSPNWSGRPDMSGCIIWKSLRCQDIGRCGLVRKYLSAGWPATYFGTIHAPDRVDRVTVLPVAREDSSTAMSAALLPSPTTRILLSMRSSGVRGSM